MNLITFFQKFDNNKKNSSQNLKAELSHIKKNLDPIISNTLGLVLTYSKI